MSPNINDLRLVRGILLPYSFNYWVVGQPHGRSVASRSPVASIYAHAPVRTFAAEILKNIYIFFYFPKKHFFFYHLIGMKDIFFAIQCLCVSISFNVLLFHNSVGVTCLLFSSKQCTVTDSTRDGYNKPLTAAFSCVSICWKRPAENTGNGICETLYLGIFFFFWGGGGGHAPRPL